MQVRIEAQLLAPAKHMYIGGMNPFIAHFSGKEEVELNPWLLEDLLSDGPTTFDIRGASLIGECYSARTNIFRLNGHARSFSKSYLKRLSRLGWVIDHKALEHYHVTVMRKTCNRKLVPEISIGVFVRTTRPNPKLSREWTDEARKARKWGVRGRIIAHSDSHGLCYEVEHKDKATGWYDPSELEVVS